MARMSVMPWNMELRQPTCCPPGQAGSKSERRGTDQLRLAFDGDAVLFSDQAEKIFRRRA